MSDNDTRLANDDSRSAWDANAAFWDERMGEGNDFHLELVWPPTERLLAVHAGQRVLDVACGNGLTSRRLAAAGAHVLGIDISEGMIEHARRRRTGHDERIEYRVLDCTDEARLLALGEGAFDAAVANMALHDMAEIAPLFRALRRLLRPDAPFVFSVMHPAFNSTHAVMVAELEDAGGRIERSYSMKVRQYLEPTITQGVAIDGQPRPQPYFHRPLQALLAPAFEAGFVLDALEERAFPPGRSDGKLGWAAFPTIPPVLVLRLRRTQ
jgi:2-polyprenyl-3-methyl-5-hydroxy-6-metoxy-1,4-benzoquinol methylase